MHMSVESYFIRIIKLFLPRSDKRGRSAARFDFWGKGSHLHGLFAWPAPTVYSVGWGVIVWGNEGAVSHLFFKFIIMARLMRRPQNQPNLKAAGGEGRFFRPRKVTLESTLLVFFYSQVRLIYHVLLILYGLPSSAVMGITRLRDTVGLCEPNTVAMWYVLSAALLPGRVRPSFSLCILSPFKRKKRPRALLGFNLYFNCSPTSVSTYLLRLVCRTELLEGRRAVPSLELCS